MSSSTPTSPTIPSPPNPSHSAQTAPPTTTLAFGPDTSISDLTYFAERGCIVDLLAALNIPHPKTLGTRMLADDVKMPHRRVEVASNIRILEFVQATALEVGGGADIANGGAGCHPEHVLKYVSPTWLGRDYSVETVRSLTATEESDRYLMHAPGLLRMLAMVERGGTFARTVRRGSTPQGQLANVVPVAPPAYTGIDGVDLVSNHRYTLWGRLPPSVMIPYLHKYKCY
jgi:hypothetical protein